MAIRIVPTDIRQTASGNNLYINWDTFSQEHTAEYKVVWQSQEILTDGSLVWVVASETTTKNKYAQIGIVEGSPSMRVSITPIAENNTVNGQQIPYYTAEPSTWKYKNFDIKPSQPSAPTFEQDLDDPFKLIASVSDIPKEITAVSFEIIRDDSVSVGIYKISTITAYRRASYETLLPAGHKYSARVRYYKNNTPSDWSPVSQSTGVPPAGVVISNVKVTGKTLQGWGVKVSWKPAAGASGYKLRYIFSEKALSFQEQIDRLNYNSSEEKIISENIAYYSFVGSESLSQGGYYYFQVKSTNSYGESAYLSDSTGVSRLVIGEAPNPPTTWSNATSLTIDDPMILYWSHNSKDGSSETAAKILLTFADMSTTAADIKYQFLITVTKNSNVEAFEAIPSVTIPLHGNNITTTADFTIDTTNTGIYREGSGIIQQQAYIPPEFVEANGANIKWAVQTKSVAGDYGNASIERNVSIYITPEITVIMYYDDGTTMKVEDGVYIVERLPFRISSTVTRGYLADENPVLSRHLNIRSVNGYEFLNDLGYTTVITPDQIVYEYTSSKGARGVWKRIDAASTDFIVNNQEYIASVTATVNTGFSTTGFVKFKISFDDSLTLPSPDARVSIDKSRYIATINPFCTLNDALVNDVTLAVYRREYDGKLTEVAVNIPNNGTRFVTDPHPPLNVARYRIIATKKSTDESSYTDLPPCPVGVPHIIIQWDESYTPFDATTGRASDLTYSGSTLVLPYNIDTSESAKPSVSLVEYIGRENPVAYYGTMTNETANWTCEIPKSDMETIYMLRRLSKYQGNVYVREPSGVGYWANVSVSLSMRHTEVKVPVSLSITRVEGGL